jgi:low affinity Fe/Cu permease
MNSSIKTLARYVAYLSVAVIVFVSVVMIINYVQIKKYEPIQGHSIDKLMEKLQASPDDKELREQIRVVDLLSRKAYFTSNWQIKSGGFILLVFIILFLISAKIYSSKDSIESGESEKLDHFWIIKSKERKWLLISVGILSSVALLLSINTGNYYTDFAKYVAYHMAAWPARNGPETGPVRRASLRKMHTPHVVAEMLSSPPMPLAPADAGRPSAFFDTRHHDVDIVEAAEPPAVDQVVGYGLGLKWVMDSRRACVFVRHGGGLPGFGSDWRMAPHHGVAVVAFANRTYADVYQVNTEAMNILVAALPPRIVSRVLSPSPTLLVQQTAAAWTALMAAWWPSREGTSAAVALSPALSGTSTPALPHPCMAVNVFLDQPVAQRRHTWDRVLVALGGRCG